MRFSNGTYGELGAMRIPENHKTTLRYVDEFRLPRRKFVMDNPATYYHARNHRPEPRSALDKFRRLYRLEPGEMNRDFRRPLGRRRRWSAQDALARGKERP